MWNKAFRITCIIPGWSFDRSGTCFHITVVLHQVSFAPGLSVCVSIPQEQSNWLLISSEQTPQAIRERCFEAAAHMSFFAQPTRRLIVLLSTVYTALPAVWIHQKTRLSKLRLLVMGWALRVLQLLTAQHQPVKLFLRWGSCRNREKVNIAHFFPLKVNMLNRKEKKWTFLKEG